MIGPFKTAKFAHVQIMIMQWNYNIPDSLVATKFHWIFIPSCIIISDSSKCKEKRSLSILVKMC